MKSLKDPEFETTILNANTEELLPPIINMWGKYAWKWNIKGQWLKSPNWDDAHIRQEWKIVVVEHKTKIPNTHSKIVSYQGTRFVAEDFHAVIRTFIGMWFSQHREPYNKFQYAYVSRENPELWKVRLNFDTYEIKWEKSPLVLKIVAKTENAVVRVAHLLGLKESELLELSQ